MKEISFSEPVESIVQGFKLVMELAATCFRQPYLSTILVDLLQPADQAKIARIQYTFYAKRSRLIRRDRLQVGWVEINNVSCQAKVTSVGEYAPDKVAKLATIEDSEFPPERLDLDRVVIEPADVIRMMLSLPFSPEMRDKEIGQIDLSLVVKQGRPTWVVLQKTLCVGFRTLMFDAESGAVRFEKIDWWTANSPNFHA